MNKIFKVAIVGGGSSGLFCATEILSGQGGLSGKDVILLEATDRVGKKLVASGNGQGNLSSKNISSEFYHGDKSFIKAFLSNFSLDSLIDFYSSIGVYLTQDEEGRLYPVSKNASSVLDNIRAFLLNKELVLQTNCRVKKVEHKNHFEIITENGVFLAENVVFAFGGKSGKQFGTDGTSYHLAESFGHKITLLYPSLVQLKTSTEFLRGLKGIKEKVKISAIINGKIVKSIYGDILFTDYGVSGDAVFKISSYVVDSPNAKLSVDFAPQFSEEQLLEIITKKKKLNFIPSNEILNGLVNKRTGYNLLRYANSESSVDLVKAVKNFTLSVVGTAGFDLSQVTKGGIETDSVNPFTFRSKKQKGLYLIGELLNVDGDCGGYNLTFALLSAVCSAKDIKNKFLTEE